MTIDWFTFVVQIINFLILVALLRKFLYGPIIRAMETREEKIAARLHEADQQHDEAQQQIARYQQKARDIDQQREDIVAEARQQARDKQQQLVDQAKADVERRRSEWLQEFERERDQLLAEIRRQAGHMSAEAARRTLSQLANRSLEEQMFDSFLSRLERLDADAKQEIAANINGDEAIVFIRSAFAVPDGWQHRIRETINHTFAQQANLSFEVDPELICGLELHVGGYRLGWSVSEFLADMQDNFKEKLKAQELRVS